jgi:hypothetical protein
MTRFKSHHPDSRTQGVPYAINGDFALQGDTRHPLHHQPLPHRGGAHGKEVVSHRGMGPGMTNPNVPDDRVPDGDFQEDGGYGS